MNSETKLFLGIILATVVIIAGAVFAFSRPVNAPQVKQELLVRADSPKIGSASATAILVEFGDFQCPACGAYHTVVKQLLERNKDSLALVFRHFPLPSHANALPAARAVEAAGKQGKFWEMYDKIYESQRDWSAEKNVRATFVQYAKDLGLNTSQFEGELDSDEVQKRIYADVVDARTLGVNATPTFYLNNEKIKNPRSLEEFDALIKAAKAKAPKPSDASQETYHIHANVKVIVDGKPIDFSQSKYQSKEGQELDENIHFHDGKGDLINIHKKGMKLSDLFASFGLSFGEKQLKLYVNKKPNTALLTYEPQDLDRILFVDSSVTNPETLFTSVADDACIYSEKCPERGTPPTEECAGGLGTECE